MPRVTRIDRADAFKAIESIVQRGEAPTHINVRSELGQRGSPPVISNFIGSWFAVYGPTLAGNAAQSAGAPAPPVASTNVMDGNAIAALTAAALEQIQQAAVDRDAEQGRKFEIERQGLAEERLKLEAERAAFADQLRAHEVHFARAYQDRDVALKERDLAHADAAGLKGVVSNLKGQIAALQANYDALIMRVQAEVLP